MDRGANGQKIIYASKHAVLWLRRAPIATGKAGGKANGESLVMRASTASIRSSQSDTLSGCFLDETMDVLIAVVCIFMSESACVPT